ncbi:hypothetical protein ScPMuIL_005646 [Solemya velum]
MFKPVPYDLYVTESDRFWVHYGLVILGFALAVITAIVQWCKPAPYGKHEPNGASLGPVIPQRIGHMMSDAIPGIGLLLLVFFLYGTERSWTNYTFLALFIVHYINRGIIHPLTMRYSNPNVLLAITLGGFIPNCLYHFLQADFLGSAKYTPHYYYDPRFIIGISMFVIGIVINKWADLKMRSLRKKKDKDENGLTGYSIPFGGLFEVISCPNYFGELVEWLGWSIATWSLAGLVWCLFAAATFVPRSWHNHQWYKAQFENYPPKRRALLPFIY